jgi:hypothetical protein
MLKKAIKFTDFNGNEQVEEAYFHLSKVDIIEMEAGKSGGLEAHIKRVVDTKDNAEIVSVFKEIILSSYGVKSEDGRRFIKEPQATKEFSQSAAFDELYVEIATDANKAAAFIKGVLPNE